MSRLEIGGDPWASRPDVSRKYCAKCIKFNRDYDRTFGETGWVCPAKKKPWTLECRHVKDYLGDKKR